MMRLNIEFPGGKYLAIAVAEHIPRIGEKIYHLTKQFVVIDVEYDYSSGIVIIHTAMFPSNSN